MTPKFLFATLMVLLMTLALTEACRFGRFYTCQPDQWGCSGRGGKCMVRGGRCQCVPARLYYGYGLTPGTPGGNYYYGGGGYPRGGRGRYREPEGHGPGGSEKGAFSEGAIERQTNMMLQMTRMYNLIN